MKTRKEFLAAAAAVPLIAAAPAPPSPPPPAPSPAPTPKRPAISDTARALAQSMRKFDSSLTEKQTEEIATGIDYNLRVGERVDPHGTELKNWNEPATIFEVPA